MTHKQFSSFSNAVAKAIEDLGGNPRTAKGLTFQQSPAWDSVGHMGLVAQLEDQFGIMMEPDDIVDLNSYEKGKEMLAEKYGVEF